MATIARICGCHLLFVVVFFSVGCFAIDLDEATKEFIKCMLDNQDATYGISTGPLRAVFKNQVR
jgi:hypothetical protein